MEKSIDDAIIFIEEKAKEAAEQAAQIRNSSEENASDKAFVVESHAEEFTQMALWLRELNAYRLLYKAARGEVLNEIDKSDALNYPEHYQSIGMSRALESFDKMLASMRPATKEESQSISKYIDSISSQTEVNFWDLVDKGENRDKIEKAIEVIRKECDCVLSVAMNDCGRDCSECSKIKPAFDTLDALCMAIRSLKAWETIRYSIKREMDSAEVENEEIWDAAFQFCLSLIDLTYGEVLYNA